ncbi:hypothetical protein L2W58_06110 [Dethiosulfovibrio sp. F2B]|nr:hypothetical protein [Dethiosulfovibrio faecalis]
MVEKLLSFKEVAARAGLGESRARTLRERYLKAVPSVGEGRSRRYAEAAASVLSRANELEKQGKKDREILEELLRGRDCGNSHELDEVLNRLDSEVIALRRQLKLLRQESSSLKRKVDYLEKKLCRVEKSSWGFREFLEHIVLFVEDILDF